MQKWIVYLTLFGCLVGCASQSAGSVMLNTPAASATSTITPDVTATPAAESAGTAVPAQPAATQIRPVNTGINPLTGLPPADPALLNRRPVIVKVENLPRNNRPQFGLSKADLVYEYHTEEGTTRYAAVFYGQNAERVGPIRSGRWFDINLIRMYKSIFIFGSAYERLLTHLLEADFGDRLILEGPVTAATLQRYDPNGQNLLLANLTELPGVIDYYHIDNAQQPLDGMTFNKKAPVGGKALQRVYIRYSGAIYNRWDYDVNSQRYMRYVDAEDDINRDHEVYAQMVDRENDEPIAADNVVILLARNFVVEPNVYDVELTGSQKAYLLRDGQIYEVKWQREKEDDVLTLVDEDGKAVAFKPGTTWFEVLSLPAEVKMVKEGEWRFGFIMPE